MHRFLLIFAILTFLTIDKISAQIDYNDSIQPIFNDRCVGCHGGTSGVTLTSYDAALNSVGHQYDKNVIVPGEPDESPLIDKISSSNPQFGIRMPGDGTTLSDTQINAIRQWIEEGAHESVETSGELTAIVPTEFRLIGNYPNPFNPSTVIRFETPESSEFLLSIYSVTGKKLREYSGIAQAGQTEYAVNMSSEPSGVYFYRIRFSSNNNFNSVFTSQMTLIK